MLGKIYEDRQKNYINFNWIILITTLKFCNLIVLMFLIKLMITEYMWGRGENLLKVMHGLSFYGVNFG